MSLSSFGSLMISNAESRSWSVLCRHLILVFLAMLFSWVAEPAYAGSRVAVLEMQGDADSKVLMLMSDEVRAGVLSGVGSSDYVVMSRENITVLLRDMGLDPTCVEGECEVETGRNLGAQYIVSGRLVRVEDAWFCTVKLHETEKGTLLASGTVRAQSVTGLIDELSAIGRAQIKKVVDRQKGERATPGPKSIPVDAEDIWREGSGAAVNPSTGSVAWLQSGPVRKDHVAKPDAHVVGKESKFRFLFSPLGVSVDRIQNDTYVWGSARAGILLLSGSLSPEIGIDVGEEEIAPVLGVNLALGGQEQSTGFQGHPFVGVNTRISSHTQTADLVVAAGIRIQHRVGIYVLPALRATYWGGAASAGIGLGMRAGWAF